MSLKQVKVNLFGMNKNRKYDAVLRCCITELLRLVSSLTKSFFRTEASNLGFAVVLCAGSEIQMV